MMKAPLMKTRDSTRRRCTVRSRRHVNRRACIRRHPGGDSPPPQDRRGGVRVRGAPCMSAQCSRLLVQVVAHRRRHHRSSVGRGRQTQASDHSNRHLCRRYSSSHPPTLRRFPYLLTCGTHAAKTARLRCRWSVSDGRACGTLRECHVLVDGASERLVGVHVCSARGFRQPLLLELFGNQSCGHQQLDMLSLLLWGARDRTSRW